MKKPNGGTIHQGLAGKIAIVTGGGFGIGRESSAGRL